MEDPETEREVEILLEADEAVKKANELLSNLVTQVKVGNAGGVDIELDVSQVAANLELAALKIRSIHARDDD